MSSQIDRQIRALEKRNARIDDKVGKYLAHIARLEARVAALVEKKSQPFRKPMTAEQRAAAGARLRASTAAFRSLSKSQKAEVKALNAVKKVGREMAAGRRIALNSSHRQTKSAFLSGNIPEPKLTKPQALALRNRGISNARAGMYASRFPSASLLV